MSHKQQVYVCVTKSHKDGRLSCTPIPDINESVHEESKQEKKVPKAAKNCSKCHSKAKILSDEEASGKFNNKKFLPTKNALMDVKVPITKNLVALTCPTDGSSGNGVVPIQQAFPGGEPICPDGSVGYRIPYPTNGTYTVMDSFTVTITTLDEVTFSWSANRPGVTQVIAKGGTLENLYNYSNLEVADSCLKSPLNNGGNVPQLSHIDICYNPDIVILYGLKAEKTALPQFTRSYNWDINKTGDKSELTLSLGQTYPVNYSVGVTPNSTDSDWKITGTITITNTNTGAGQNISIENVVDNVNPTAVVTCPVALPYSLAPGVVLVCSYVAELPNSDNGINTATVSARRNDITNDFLASQGWDFNSVVPTEIDKCVTVSDDRYGALGTFCASPLGETRIYSYTLNVGPYDVCNTYEFDNTATLVTNTNYIHKSASHSISINVPCSGCTLTPGYWKTHSKFGPAPYDADWNNLEDSIFFLSNATYYNVLWTSPGGNAYYILSSAWIAASLNVLGGASVPAEVQAALNAGKNLFLTYTPAQIVVLKGSSSLRQQFISNAKTLDDYNNGIIGPGHCTI